MSLYLTVWLLMWFTIYNHWITHILGVYQLPVWFISFILATIWHFSGWGGIVFLLWSNKEYRCDNSILQFHHFWWIGNIFKWLCSLLCCTQLSNRVSNNLQVYPKRKHFQYDKAISNIVVNSAKVCSKQLLYYITHTNF